MNKELWRWLIRTDYLTADFLRRAEMAKITYIFGILLLVYSTILDSAHSGNYRQLQKGALVPRLAVLYCITTSYAIQGFNCSAGKKTVFVLKYQIPENHTFLRARIWRLCEKNNKKLDE